MNSNNEFVIGKHNIGWVDSDFKKRFDNVEFEVKQVPVFKKLPRYMKDAAIESELTPGLCDLGDVLAFIDSAPEECKDSYWNLFYTKDFVVGVYWYSRGGGWYVFAWNRVNYGGWRTDERVFSPATVNFDAKSLALESLDTRVTKIEKVLKITDNAVAEKLITEIQEKLKELKKLI